MGRLPIRPLLSSLPLALAMIAVFATVPSPTLRPAEAASRACASAGSKTVRQTSQVRVFRKRGMTYACRYRTGRKFWLGDEDCYPDSCVIAQLRVAGPFVGYEFNFKGRSSFISEVRVRDLRSGRYLRLVTRGADGCMTAVGQGLVPDVTDLELKGNGSVAWVSRSENLWS